MTDLYHTGWACRAAQHEDCLTDSCRCACHHNGSLALGIATAIVLITALVIVILRMP
jgi:hypothetical protein